MSNFNPLLFGLLIFLFVAFKNCYFWLAVVDNRHHTLPVLIFVEVTQTASDFRSIGTSQSQARLRSKLRTKQSQSTARLWPNSWSWSIMYRESVTSPTSKDKAQSRTRGEGFRDCKSNHTKINSSKTLAQHIVCLILEALWFHRVGIYS